MGVLPCWSYLFVGVCVCARESCGGDMCFKVSCQEMRGHASLGMHL